MAAAWVIEWEWIGDHRALNEAPVYVLPYRWSGERVMSFMRAIYFNKSELFHADYGLYHMSRTDCYKRLEINEGPRMMYGSNPLLIGVYTRDFKSTTAEDGVTEILTWTRPAGERLDPTTLSFETLGSPASRRVERTS